MTQRMYTLIAGVVFLLIAVGHLMRVFYQISFVVYDIQIPMWASLVAAVVMGLLAYEGFHLAGKTPHR